MTPQSEGEAVIARNPVHTHACNTTLHNKIQLVSIKVITFIFLLSLRMKMKMKELPGSNGRTSFEEKRRGDGLGSGFGDGGFD